MTTPKRREARVTRTVRDFRTGIINREKTAIGALVQAYDAAYESLIDELTAATENAQRSIDRGDRVVNTWRVNRAVELTQQAEQLLGDIARQGGGAIAQQRRGAAQDAFQAAGRLLDTVMGEPPESFPNASSFMRFPTGAMEQLTGTLSGGPLQELLDDAADQGAQKAGKVLTGAIVTGTHPSLIAEALREALDSSMYRASLIARTEINRTYRESLRETMRANRHIIPKWRWRSARSLTTCAACWAMDGREFDVDEPMGTHPGCRCSLEPEPIGWDALAKMHGFEMPPGDWSIPREPTGPEAFAALPAEQQQRILDPGRKDDKTPRWDAYNAGQVELRDFVHTTHSDDWGTTRRESGLSAALEHSTKRNGGVLPGRPIEPKPAKPIPEPVGHEDLVTMQEMSVAQRKALGFDFLPPTEWEAPLQRKRLPVALQEIIGAPTPFLRVPQRVYDKQIREEKHLWLKALFDDLDQVLEGWEAIVPQSNGNWRILRHATVPGTKKHIVHLTVVGVDASGSVNLVSMHGRTETFFQKQIKASNAIVRGEGK